MRSNTAPRAFRERQSSCCGECIVPGVTLDMAGPTAVIQGPAEATGHRRGPSITPVSKAVPSYQRCSSADLGRRPAGKGCVRRLAVVVGHGHERLPEHGPDGLQAILLAQLDGPQVAELVRGPGFHLGPLARPLDG